MVEHLTVLVVSDASGETAERVVRSALVQFETADVTIRRFGSVRTQAQVHEVMHQAAHAGALIIHTLVSDQLRRFMLEQARLHGVDAMDLLGPVLDRLANRLALTPQEKPGLFQQLAEAKSRAIEAVDYAFRHDDGRRVEELARAELVLVGVSRTMKTPTMLYLAYRGWFVGNVPLVPAVPPPREVTELPAERVFCLLMSPARAGGTPGRGSGVLRRDGDHPPGVALLPGSVPATRLAAHRCHRQVRRGGVPGDHRGCRTSRW